MDSALNPSLLWCCRQTPPSILGHRVRRNTKIGGLVLGHRTSREQIQANTMVMHTPKHKPFTRRKSGSLLCISECVRWRAQRQRSFCIEPALSNSQEGFGGCKALAICRNVGFQDTRLLWTGQQTVTIKAAPKWVVLITFYSTHMPSKFALPETVLHFHSMVLSIFLIKCFCHGGLCRIYFLFNLIRWYLEF